MLQEASISFTDGQGSPTKTSKPGTPAKPDPILEQKKKQLLNQQKMIQKKLKKLTPISAHMKAIAFSLLKAQDEQKLDPLELFRNIQRTLYKMGVRPSMILQPQTKIIEGEVKKGLSLFQVTFRREADVTDDTIDRIKRNKENFKSIEWNPKGMVLTLWAPYKKDENQVPTAIK